MPQIIKYSIEIRMYSLGMLFVTLTFISGIKWLEEGNNKELYKLAIFALLSAYTHYFAGISVACIYLFIIIDRIVKKDFLGLKKLIFSILVIFLLYLPWIITIIKQILTVKENYWIGDMTENVIKGFFRYPFTVSGSKILTNFVKILLIIFLISLFHKDIKSRYSIYGFLTTIGTIIIGIIASIIIRPVFISRYMICSLGCLWLGISMNVSEICKNKYIFNIIIIIVLIITIWTNNRLIKIERNYQEEMEKLSIYINNIIEEPVTIIFDSNQLQRMIAYYYPSIQNYVYKQEITDLTKRVYKQTNMQILDDIKLENLIQNEIYFFIMEKDILKEIEDNGYEYEKYDNYQLETYKFEIYKLK